MNWHGTKWEYKSVNLDQYGLSDVALQVVFSELGNEGWELVTIISAERHNTAFFRRPVLAVPDPKFNNDKA